MLTAEVSKFRIGSGATALASILCTASRKAPLLVLAHGFAGNKNENGLFSQAADYFVENDLSVLRFDFRACGENTGKFKNVRLHDLVDDLHNVFFWVKSQPELRSLPIGFVGFSLGAGIGLLAELPIVDCNVFWSPAIYTRTDLVPRYEPELTEKGYIIKGNIKVSKEFIDDLDTDTIPNALTSVTAPVLLIHGSVDQRIPPKSSEVAFESLRHTSRDADLVIVPGADHSFRANSGIRRLLFSRSINWFKKHLTTSNWPVGDDHWTSRHPDGLADARF